MQRLTAAVPTTTQLITFPVPIRGIIRPSYKGHLDHDILAALPQDVQRRILATQKETPYDTSRWLVW